MVALGRLRKQLRDDPNARNCHICAWRTPDGALGNVTPRMRRVLRSLQRGTFDLDSFIARREVIESAIASLLELGLVDFVDGKYAINARGREELEDRG